MKTLFVLLLLFAVTALLPAAAAPLRIVAAENFYGGVAREIVGGDAEITSILSNPNQDPHEFTTSAETAKAVADADIVIYNGISYDPWMDKLLGIPGKNDRVVVCVASLIGAKDGGNPHIWYDEPAMPILAARLVAALSAINPASGDAYQKRLDEFDASLQPLFKRTAAMHAKLAGTVVTATEPVFGYMANTLGLKMLNYDFQIAIMNDTEPTADQTAAFEKCLRTRTAKILFYNSQVTDPTTSRLQELAKSSGVPVVGVTETQPPDEKTYAGWMLHELDGVQAALAGKTQ